MNRRIYEIRRRCLESARFWRRVMKVKRCEVALPAVGFAAAYREIAKMLR